jgi:hypothetical protein
MHCSPPPGCLISHGFPTMGAYLACPMEILYQLIRTRKGDGGKGGFQHSSPSHAPFCLPTQIGLIFTSCQSLHLSTALSLAIQLLPPHTASACLPLLALLARFTSLSLAQSLHFTGLADRPVFPPDCLAPADNYPYPLSGAMMRPPLTSLCSS